jgi:hypothetical protein
MRTVTSSAGKHPGKCGDRCPSGELLPPGPGADRAPFVRFRPRLPRLQGEADDSFLPGNEADCAIDSPGGNDPASVRCELWQRKRTCDRYRHLVTKAQSLGGAADGQRHRHHGHTQHQVRLDHRPGHSQLSRALLKVRGGRPGLRPGRLALGDPQAEARRQGARGQSREDRHGRPGLGHGREPEEWDDPYRFFRW